MTPKSEGSDSEAKQPDQLPAKEYSKSFPQVRYPPFRDSEKRSTHQWLVGKRLVDGAEGLWRIHDGLYDLTRFMDMHPGGEEWLSLTKGTDITEAFETHHLKGIAETYLKHFYVRDAKTARNSPFTMKENGFYKTLKRKAEAKLKEIPERERWAGRLRSKILADSLLIGLFITSVVNCWALDVNPWYSVVLTILGGVLANYVTNTGHTFFHRADNFRMYYFNVTGTSHQDWRVSHALCHHMFTNTAEDLELSLMEPDILYVPYSVKNKSWYRAYAGYFWPLIYIYLPIRIIFNEYHSGLTGKGGKKLGPNHFIFLILPTVMYIFGGQSLFITLCLWIPELIIATWMVIFIAIHAGHHNDTNFFEGDKPVKEVMDWGEHEMTTICERTDRMNKSVFQGLLHFGDHVLHHMFPTLDPSELTYLYPLFIEHCKEFDVEHKKIGFLDALKAHSNQLKRYEAHDFTQKK